MSLDRQRRRFQLNRLESYGLRPPQPRPDRITRIGRRDGATALWEVLHPDGSITTNGIKVFNTAVPYGTPVLGIPRQDGMIALELRDTVRPPEPTQNTPFLMVALIAVSATDETPIDAEFGINSRLVQKYFLKVGDRPPVPVFDYRSYFFSTYFQNRKLNDDDESRNIYDLSISPSLEHWDYLGNGSALLHFPAGGAFDYVRRDTILIESFRTAQTHIYYFDDYDAPFDLPSQDVGQIFQDEARRRLNTWSGRLREYEGWLPLYRYMDGGGIVMNWGNSRFINYPRGNYPYYAEQEDFTRQYLGRRSRLPVLAEEESPADNLISNSVRGLSQAGDWNQPGQPPRRINSNVRWNVSRSLQPIAWAFPEDFQANDPRFMGVTPISPTIFRVQSRPGNIVADSQTLEPIQIGETAPFALTVADLITIGFRESDAIRIIENRAQPSNIDLKFDIRLKVTDLP